MMQCEGRVSAWPQVFRLVTLVNFEGAGSFESQQHPEHPREFSMNAFARMLLSVIAALAAWSISVGAYADVPGRVGRIAFMEGDVQSYSENDPQWKVAYVNQPITSRNSVFTGDTGRAELSVGSTTLAMDAGSQVDIQELDDNTFNANVVRGRVSLRIRHLDPSDAYNVAIPGADFALLKPGRYRIDALQDSTGVTVFAGQASATSDTGAVLVNAGTSLRARSDANNPDAVPSFQSVASVPVPLDDWVMAREARFRDSQAARFVSPNMTGYEDLDNNGRWASDSDYGPVWYPTAHVRDDWVPYRYGRWAYVAPWGYTWVDDAPWGFAPFHYGRWVQVSGRWGWCPGAYVARPVYAPALVGFYGGSGFSAAFSVGNSPAVGWYPLAPWERYSPHYTRNAAYIREVNNITIVNPPARFAREREAGDWNRFHGGTVAPQQAFASQRSISRVAMAAPRDMVGRARSVDVAALPQPAAIPAAVRNGPRPGEGIGRPEFRSPREFAQRPVEARDAPNGGRGPNGVGPSRVGEAAIAPPQGQMQPQRPVQTRDGSVLPPNYRRLPEGDGRGIREANGQAVLPGQAERPTQVPHREGQVPFNANARPMGQQAPPIEGQLNTQQQPRFEPRSNPRGDGGRRGDPQQVQQPVPQQPQVQQPRPQPQAATPAFEEQQPRFERPHREQRNIQAQPQPIQPVERQQPQAIERPQPRAQVPQAPQPVPVPQPRVQPPQPQPQPPQPQPQPQRQEAPRAEPPRLGPPNQGRGEGIRGIGQDR